VSVHYTGWLTDGTQFDTSLDGDEPTTFQLGGVIAGWTEGVGSMQVGGKRKLIIPAELAYQFGRGPGGKLPPAANLIFDVELISIAEPPAKQPQYTLEGRVTTQPEGSKPKQ
jgi:FKBP-type peptidyl-prolyl cis-trans isomerase